MRTHAFALFLLLCVVSLGNAFYSISYSADASHPTMVNVGASFVEAPDATHVADFVARMSGRAPLLKTDNARLPTMDIFADKSSATSPVILEVHGGKLPLGVTQVVRAQAFQGESRGPSLQSVMDELHLHGIDMQSKSMDGHDEKSAEVASWMQAQQGRPIIVLHHEQPSSYHFVARSLASTTVAPLTEFQISQYQICMWTGIGMIVLLLSAVLSIARMEVIPDSLLFAKFLSNKTKHE